MSTCMEMPGVPAAVYLVLQVTTVSPVERMGGERTFKNGCVGAASVLVHVRKKSPPAVPGVGLPQPPPSVLR